jgi:protein-tyrosine phosphatase
MEASVPRSNKLASVPNFRDVAAKVPGMRAGMLFRSDMVMTPDEADAPQIAACGIRLVIDLRSPSEQQRAPHHWFTQTGVEISGFDVAGRADPRIALERFAADNTVDGAHEMMRSAYEGFSAGALPVLRFLGERIEAGQLPLLVHCTAGKDRTGFTIAMLLFALGIPRDAINHDYLESHGREHHNAVEATRAIMNALLPNPITEEALARMSGVHVDYLESALAEVARTYGSLSAYLQLAGFDEKRVARLREILLEA